tara:strand:+ start:1529 stop:1957 length:429 start_codon:yes stop_codon:yes gene_type:complete
MIYLNFIFIITLLITSIIDWRSYRIPNRSVLILAMVSFIFIFLNNSWSKSITSGALILTLFSLLYGLGYLLKKQEIIGIGDIKLCTILGLTLYLQNIPLFFILMGTFGILTNLYFRAKKKTAISPLGPAICLSYFIVIYLFQ